MMRLSEIMPDAGLVLCPHGGCGKNVNPFVKQRVPEMPNANPPIPARVIVTCPCCRKDWYMVDLS